MATYQYKKGLVLSGGGARGFAHLGVLQALFEKGFKPDIISGTSAGAIVGAFIADGKNPTEILQFFAQKSLFNFIEFSYPKYGLMRFTGLARVVKENLTAKTFEELKIPLIVAVTNLNASKVEYLDQGDLANAVLASASIPGLVKPIKINGITYVDGGVLDNFPIKPIWNQCKFLVGVHLNPDKHKNDFPNVVSILEQAFHLSISKSMRYKAKKCDVFIEPPDLGNFHLTEASKAKAIFEIGYKYAKRILKDKL